MLAKWCCASLAAKRRFQTCLASLVELTKFCEASKDRITLADSRCSPSFSPVLNQSARKSRSPTRNFLDPPPYRHPSYLYPSIWAYVTHVTLDPRLPLFSRACVEKIGEPGNEATILILIQPLHSPVSFKTIKALSKRCAV